MTSPSTPTLWVHVSTLLNWSRPPVGIVRVEQEYARAMVERAPHEPIRFCLFDLPSGRFVEVPAHAVRAKLGIPLLASDLEAQAEAARAQQAQSSDRARALPAWKRAAKSVVLGGIGLLPAAWQPGVRTTARQWQHALIEAVRAVREQVYVWRHGELPPPPPPPPEPPRSPFAHGDRFVSLGLDWDTLDQRVLYRLKRELGLHTTLICYDAIPILRPHLVTLRPGSFAAYFVDMAWCADAILCISEHTRRDCEQLLRRFGVPVPPTHVIRLGAQIGGQAPESAPPAGFKHDRPFVLFVSTIERRKNHEVLYRAWVRLREQGRVPHRLVFVGMKGWGVSDLVTDLQLDPRIQDDIVCLNHVSDAELAWLYRHCDFTAFPSLYEGWGLPVVESLAWGKFCLSSNTSSLPEAGGDFAEYLDPWDLNAWVERLAFYMDHPQQVQARNERIAREFTAPRWSDTAAQIHRVVMSQGAPGSPGAEGSPAPMAHDVQTHEALPH